MSRTVVRELLACVPSFRKQPVQIERFQKAAKRIDSWETIQDYLATTRSSQAKDPLVKFRLLLTLLNLNIEHLLPPDIQIQLKSSFDELPAHHKEHYQPEVQKLEAELALQRLKNELSEYASSIIPSPTLAARFNSSMTKYLNSLLQNDVNTIQTLLQEHGLLLADGFKKLPLESIQTAYKAISDIITPTFYQTLQDECDQEEYFSVSDSVKNASTLYEVLQETFELHNLYSVRYSPDSLSHCKASLFSCSSSNDSTSATTASPLEKDRGLASHPSLFNLNATGRF